jgi:Flp pilus assembly protein TadD
MMDVSVFGVEPWGHHLVNVLFHIANTLLVYLVLLKGAGAVWRSALVAAIFAVHPLHVESVAWVAERKDVLSTFFGLLAILAYFRFARLRGSRAASIAYALAIFAFAQSLMSKPMLVTLPAVLVLFDIWPLRRLRVQGGSMSIMSLLLEKVPFLALSVASSIITVIAQRQGGVIASYEHLPIDQRLATAVVAYATYLAKTIWPVDLAAVYPHPGQWPAATVAVSAGTLVVMTIIAGAFVWRNRWAPLIGWLFYLGTLVPVIGLVQVGSQAMADRYTYVPLIGIFIMIAWVLPDGLAKHLRVTTGVLLGVWLAVLSAVSVVQIGYWRNSVSLFEHAARVTQRNYIAHVNLAFTYAMAGEFDAASRNFAQALQINPPYAKSNDFLGRELMNKAFWPRATKHYQQLAEAFPNDAGIANSLGVALMGENRLDEAIAKLREAVRVDPHYASAHANLGRALLQSQSLAEAQASLQAAIAIDPSLPEAHANLGLIYAMNDQLEQAISEFRAALKLRPNYPEAQQYLNTAIEQRNAVQQN